MLFYPNPRVIDKKSKIQQEPGTATRGLGTGCQGSGYSNPRHIRRLFFREGRPEMKQKLSPYPRDPASRIHPNSILRRYSRARAVFPTIISKLLIDSVSY